MLVFTKVMPQRTISTNSTFASLVIHDAYAAQFVDVLKCQSTGLADGSLRHFYFLIGWDLRNFCVNYIVYTHIVPKYLCTVLAFHERSTYAHVCLTDLSDITCIINGPFLCRLYGVYIALKSRHWFIDVRFMNCKQTMQ